ncbi:MAG: type II toxin-antitoxin system HicA family toxin [Candidatus Hydrogenedentota bacterium]
MRIVKALEKAGFTIRRQGKHITMSDGISIIQVPRNNPVKKYTLKEIIEDAGLTIEQFKNMIWLLING